MIALLSAVLIKLFADRQISVPPTLIAYLISPDGSHLFKPRALLWQSWMMRALAQGTTDHAPAWLPMCWTLPDRR